MGDMWYCHEVQGANDVDKIGWRCYNIFSSRVETEQPLPDPNYWRFNYLVEFLLQELLPRTLP